MAAANILEVEERNTIRVRRTAGIGLVLMTASVVAFISWMLWFQTRTWRPVNKPISLSKGTHFNSGDFTVNLDAQYAIDVSAKGKIPVDELGCLLGNDMRSNCTNPSVVRAEWRLLSKGKVARAGTSDDSIGGGAVYSTGEAFRTIGFFQGEIGQHYQLEVDVLADGSNLAASDPQLSVKVFDTKYESGLAFSGFLRLVCLVIGLIGSALFLSSILAQKRNPDYSTAIPRS